MNLYYNNTFLDSIKELSKTCANPKKIVESMKHMVVKTIQKCKCLYVKDLFVALINNHVGTPEVANLSARLCKRLNKQKEETLIEKVMKWKLTDARKDLRKQVYEEKKLWKECRAEFDLEKHTISISYGLNKKRR